MSRQFQRRPENFTCAHCGLAVIGNGYTNHCPRCLWSQHVDERPGDRLSACGGPMEPIGVEFIHDCWVIRHRCQRCQVERRNRNAKNDDHGVLIHIAAVAARREAFRQSEDWRASTDEHKKQTGGQARLSDGAAMA